MFSIRAVLPWYGVVGMDSLPSVLTNLPLLLLDYTLSPPLLVHAPREVDKDATRAHPMEYFAYTVLDLEVSTNAVRTQVTNTEYMCIYSIVSSYLHRLQSIR